MNKSIIPIKIFKPSTNDLTFGTPLYLFFSTVGIKDDPKLFLLEDIVSSSKFKLNSRAYGNIMKIRYEHIDINKNYGNNKAKAVNRTVLGERELIPEYERNNYLSDKRVKNAKKTVKKKLVTMMNEKKD